MTHPQNQKNAESSAMDSSPLIEETHPSAEETTAPEGQLTQIPSTDDTAAPVRLDGPIAVQKDSQCQSPPQNNDSDSGITPEMDQEGEDLRRRMEQSTEREESGTTPTPIIFVDPLSTRVSLPFDTCKTWDGMKETIKKVFEALGYPKEYNDYLSEQAADKRIFQMIRHTPNENPNSSVILLDFWEETIQPGLEVSIKFSFPFLDDIKFMKMAQVEPPSGKAMMKKNNGEAIQDTESKPPSETDESKKSSEPVYEQKVKYTIDFYEENGPFLGQKHSDAPITFQQSLKSGEVLQEITKVTRPTQSQPSVTQFDIHHPLNVPLRERIPDYELNHGDKIGSVILKVHSKLLLDALKSVIEFQSVPPEMFNPPSIPMPTSRRSGPGPVTGLTKGEFAFPFKDLYLHLEDLKRYKTEQNPAKERHTDEYNSECNAHIDILIDYLESHPTVHIHDAKRLFSRNLTTFGWLWLLLAPGSDVYTLEKGQLNAYVVESVEQSGDSGRALPYVVNAWNLKFDGVHLSRSLKEFSIPFFEGEKDIRSLLVYPTQYHGDKADRGTLIERGRKYIRVVQEPSFQQYVGPGSTTVGRKYTGARVIVDHVEQPWKQGSLEHNPQRSLVGRQWNQWGLDYNYQPPKIEQAPDLGSWTRVPGCECAKCLSLNAGSPVHNRPLKFDDYDNIDLRTHGPLKEHQYFLCWSHVHAFILKDRVYDLVTVEGLREPNIDKTVIDSLVMSNENKGMIKAICETYNDGAETSNPFFADFIHGKGEGQIILLHGPPGTGKTLTAESVAEYTSRPLLSITAADLGNAMEIETNLLRFFRNAARWDAIVLLDEADVYLEKRSTNDLNRNSIVSVFLRALEYFQGILFLTTNRVGVFDLAFMSRIHIQLVYYPLNEDARQEIWKNSFKKLEKNHHNGGREIRCAWDVRNFVQKSTDLKGLEWNGREIRNAFQTAVALATFEAKQDNELIPTVRGTHLEEVVRMSMGFKNYMKSTLRATDSDIASREKLRDDKFKHEE